MLSDIFADLSIADECETDGASKDTCDIQPLEYVAADHSEKWFLKENTVSCLFRASIRLVSIADKGETLLAVFSF